MFFKGTESTSETAISFHYMDERSQRALSKVWKIFRNKSPSERGNFTTMLREYMNIRE